MVVLEYMNGRYMVMNESLKNSKLELVWKPLMNVTEKPYRSALSLSQIFALVLFGNSQEDDIPANTKETRSHCFGNIPQYDYPHLSNGGWSSLAGPYEYTLEIGSYKICRHGKHEETTLIVRQLLGILGKAFRLMTTIDPGKNESLVDSILIRNDAHRTVSLAGR